MQASDEALSASLGGLSVEYYQPLTISEGNLTIAFYHVNGVFVGEYEGIPPNSNPVRAAGVKMWRFDNGKVVEHWTLFDMLGFIGQMTAEPA